MIEIDSEVINHNGDLAKYKLTSYIIWNKNVFKTRILKRYIGK